MVSLCVIIGWHVHSFETTNNPLALHVMLLYVMTLLIGTQKELICLSPGLSKNNFFYRCIHTLSDKTPYRKQIHGPLTKYVKLRVVHAPGMLETFFPPYSDPSMHHCTCVTHVPSCMQGSLTSGFLWSRMREKRTRHSRRMHNMHLCVSGKRPVANMVKMAFSRWPL